MVRFSSGTTTIAGSYDVANIQILSGATVNANESYRANEIDGITSATKLSGNLTIQENGVLQSHYQDNLEHGMLVGGNLENNGIIQGTRTYWANWWWLSISHTRISVKGNIINNPTGKVGAYAILDTKRDFTNYGQISSATLNTSSATGSFINSGTGNIDSSTIQYK